MAHRAELDLTRRAFLGGSALAAAAAIVAACAPNTPPTASPSATPTPTPTPSPTPSPPTGYFDALAELRDAVRGSKDHLPAEADRLVAAGDVAAITAFVRDSIATYPAGLASPGDPVAGRRWGTRATLRGGAGTPREKADLLAELIARTGATAEVVDVKAPSPLTPAGLFKAAAKRPHFDPATSDERMAALRVAMGLAAVPAPTEPLDPDGQTSAALASGLIARFESPPKASDPFEIRAITTVPMVRIVRVGKTELADPVTDTGIALESDRDVRRAPDPGDLLDVRVLVEAARSDAPERRFPLVEGTWTADQLVGRRLFVSFPPPAENLEELVLLKPRDVNLVIPILAVRSQDLDAEATRALAVAGTPFTLGGDLVDIDGADGIVRVNGESVGVVGPPDPAKLAAVRTLQLTAESAAFPTVSLGVRALDATGAPVEGLTATAFRALDGATPVGTILERSSAPPPRVLILLDASDSIPEAFRGEGAAGVTRLLGTRLKEADPRVTFRVAMISFDEAAPAGDWTSDPDELSRQATKVSGFGSELWESLADAAKLGATAIVLVTDGAATNGNDPITTPPPGSLAQVKLGPKTVVVGVGKVDQAGLEALGEAGGLGAFPVADQTAAVEAVVGALALSPEPSYRFRYTAPEAGPTTRDVRLELLGTSVVGAGTYEVPPLDQRARAPGLSGLFLTVQVGATEARRVLAGVDTERANTPISRLDLERVRRALFDSTVLEFEGAAPPPSVVLDDLYSAILALRPLAEATDRAARLAALAGLGAGPGLEPATLHALTVPLPAGPALTYEAGLRVTLHRDVTVPDGTGRATIRRSVDLLPSARFTTVDDDPIRAFATTAAGTARLALAEAAGFPNSTATALKGEALVPVGFSIFDLLDPLDPALAKAMDAAVEPWRTVRPRLLIPADGTPTAAWAFDGRTGSLVGLLADASGGGSEEAEIEDTFDRAERLLSGASLLSDLSSAAGLGGFSFAGGVWIQLEQTKLKKLKAATLMLASMQPPREDIGDLSDLGCGIAASAAFEAAGRIGGRLFGELGGRAASAGSAADSAGGFSCG